MTTNLLIVLGVAILYILFALAFSSYVSNMEDDAPKKRAQSIFIGINIVLLCGAMAYAYVTFL